MLKKMQKNTSKIIAIDPGERESGYVIMSGYRVETDPYFKTSYSLKPADKVDNKTMRLIIEDCVLRNPVVLTVIEKPVCRKWAGKSVSETAIWAGIFASASWGSSYMLTRSKVRWHICGSKRGNDSEIISKLIERFCPRVFHAGLERPTMIREAKRKYFYGFKGDCWQAFATGVTLIDLIMENNKEAKDALV